MNLRENLRKHLKKSIPTLAGAVVLLASAAAVQAQDDPTAISEKDRLSHETTGVVGGAVIGGIVGGPIGAVAAAAFGGWVSDLTLARKQNTQLSSALDESRKELLAMQAEMRSLEARYQVASREAQAANTRNASFSAQNVRTVQTCCADGELELHFKTNSSAIEGLYDAKLEEFAALVRKLPDAVIEITGHADRRGGSDANLALSQRRVQAVEKKLESFGVSNAAFQTNAYGESKPASATDSLENNFFDRRVVVKVISPDNGYLTLADDYPNS